MTVYEASWFEAALADERLAHAETDAELVRVRKVLEEVSGDLEYVAGQRDSARKERDEAKEALRLAAIGDA